MREWILQVTQDAALDRASTQGRLVATIDEQGLGGFVEVELHFAITEQAYSARHDDLSATGARLATTFDNNDGSHTMTAYAAGVTLTATAGTDFMNSAGGDTFVFNQAGGHDIINNFKAGEGAGHDTIQIASAAVTDWSQFSVQVVGHDTVIDLGHDASITLTGVVAPLTQHDVLFV